MQVDRIQTQLGQDTGKDRRDIKLGGKDACHHTGQCSCDQSEDEADNDIASVYQQDGTDTTAGGERAIDSQVRQIKQTISDIYAQCHDSPDQSLGEGT